jgi:poly-gamma-glutamate capsule biosynthesis protein CapA/YwtB (metallophosphatase superfamily)
LDCIAAAKIDCYILANNHTADWGRGGLTDTLSALQGAGFATAGAGCDYDAAARPAVLEARGYRLLIFAFACPSSGVPAHWGAAEGQPGVNMLNDLTAKSLARVAKTIDKWRQRQDSSACFHSLGRNWGYDVLVSHQTFAAV